MPVIVLSLVLAIILVFVTLACEIYMHYIEIQEYRFLMPSKLEDTDLSLQNIEKKSSNI